MPGSPVASLIKDFSEGRKSVWEQDEQDGFVTDRDGVKDMEWTLAGRPGAASIRKGCISYFILHIDALAVGPQLDHVALTAVSSRPLQDDGGSPKKRPRSDLGCESKTKESTFWYLLLKVYL